MADRSDAARERDGPPPAVERTVPPGSDERADAVWELKERIRLRDGLLTQRRPFFDAQYRRSACYLTEVVDPGDGGGAVTSGAGDVAGFALVRRDGYLSLLGVAPAHRRQGLGGRLVARVADDHEAVSCHVRATNGDALAFYADHGFLVEERVEGYYRDGTDAYRLVRDEARAEGLRDVLG